MTVNRSMNLISIHRGDSRAPVPSVDLDPWPSASTSRSGEDGAIWCRIFSKTKKKPAQKFEMDTLSLRLRACRRKRANKLPRRKRQEKNEPRAKTGSLLGSTHGLPRLIIRELHGSRIELYRSNCGCSFHLDTYPRVWYTRSYLAQAYVRATTKSRTCSEFIWQRIRVMYLSPALQGMYTRIHWTVQAYVRALLC